MIYWFGIVYVGEGEEVWGICEVAWAEGEAVFKDYLLRFERGCVKLL